MRNRAAGPPALAVLQRASVAPRGDARQASVAPRVVLQQVLVGPRGVDQVRVQPDREPLTSCYKAFLADRPPRSVFFVHMRALAVDNTHPETIQH